MWKLVGTPRTQKWSKRLAVEFANMDPAPHDRPLSERRLAVYEKLIRDGKFRPITWASAYCKETVCQYRVNGKHTSTLLSTWEESLDLFITVERYECDTLDDVGRLYATFDSKMQSRTANDIYLSFAACIPELKNVSARSIPTAVAGMAYYQTAGYTKGDKPQPADRAELLLEQPAFVVWIDEMFSMGKNGLNSHLKRAACIAAVFATWLKDSQDALKFWTAVRDETDHPPTMPTRKLAKYMVLNFSRLGRGRGNPSRIPDREVYAKCLHAWNAWRKDEATNLTYHSDAPMPTAR